MSLEKNKAVAIKFLDAVSGARYDEIEEMMTPDFVWWNIGPTPPFGTTERKDFIALADVLHQVSTSQLTFTYGAITAEEDRVCVEAWSHMEVRNGKTYSNTYHFLLVVRGDQIVSGKEFLDPMHVVDVLGEYMV